MKTLLTTALLCVCGVTAALAQVGKDGDVTISGTQNINQTATNLSGNANAGATSLNVKDAGGFAVGDLIMVYQAQGATVRTNTDDESWGEVTDMGNAGAYEFVEVAGVSGNTITLATGLDRSYTYQHNVGGQNFDDLVQVIKVPRYETLNVNGTIRPDAWDGSTGGVVVMEVNGDMNLNGTIDVEGLGFRGGQAPPEEFGINGRVAGFRSTNRMDGGRKGEGIAGYEEEYNRMGGQYGRGAVANGGGGGNGHNAGGGGGANAFNMAEDAWNGLGNPDPAYDDYWAVENAFGNATATPGGIAGNTSSGGGRGGYSWAAKDADPLIGTSHNDWRQYNSADWRDNIGGYGGRPVEAMPGRAYFGGGGGSGSADNGHTTDGGAGGGLVIILSNGKVVGTGTINAGGAEGGSDIQGTNNSADAASGAGAGGSVIIQSTWGVDSNIDIDVSGGVGGDQNFPFAESEGPGGGGGGGYIASFNTLDTNAPTTELGGGDAGITTTTFPLLGSRFPVNGATGGASGSTANFDIQPDAQTCYGATVQLTLPADVTALTGDDVRWYDRPSGGSPLPGTGSPWESPEIDQFVADTFYYSSGLTGQSVTRFPIIVEVTDTLEPAVDPVTICEGDQADLTATGAINYTWDNGDNGANTSVSPAQTTVYQVSGTDANGGCLGRALVTVTVKPIVSVSVTDAEICAGAQADLTASGADNYLWPDGETTPTITITSNVATTYTVTGTDADGECPSTATANVTMTDPLVITTVDASTCPGQDAVISASGADLYIWDTGGSTSAITVNTQATTVYSVTGTNAEGFCAGTATATVTIGGEATIDMPDDPTICEGNSTTITLPVTGNLTWTPAATLDTDQGSVVVATPTTTTIYNVTGDIDGCVVDEVITVNVNPIPVLTGPAPTSVCPGASANLSVSGATTYTWAPTTDLDVADAADVVSTPTADITYTVIGETDGCNATIEVEVALNPVPDLVMTPPTPVCQPLTIDITLNPGVWEDNNAATSANSTISYWTDATYTTAVATPTAIATNGTYYFRLTSDLGCIDEGSVDVTLYPEITVDATPATICEGESTTIDASGAVSYVWTGDATVTAETGPSVTVTPPTTTPYSVTGTDANGCTASTDVTVNVNPNPTVMADNHEICEGTEVTLTATGAVDYVWVDDQANPINPTVQPAATASYGVVGTDANGCSGAAAVTVTVYQLPVLVVSPSTGICAGGIATLTAEGADSYTWAPSTGLSASTGPSVDADPANTTTYTVIGTSNGCSSSELIEVQVKAAPEVDVSPDVSICIGESTELVGSLATTYAWSPDQDISALTGARVTVNPTTTTTYTVVGTTSGCPGDVEASVTVTVNELPIIDVNDGTICQGDAVELATTGDAATFAWSPSDGLNQTSGSTVQASPDLSTVYTVVGTSGAGCVDSAHSTVTVNELPSLKSDGGLICEGQNIALEVSGAATYTWAPAASLDTDQGPAVVASPTVDQTYTITGVDNNGCSSTTTATVTVLPTVVPEVSDSVTICYGEEVQLGAGGGISFLWSTRDTNSFIRVAPQETTTYSVIVSNGACEAEDSVKVIVRNPGGLTAYAPNAFTPNADGINDIFQIVTDVSMLTSFEGSIFDRWGDLIYTWTDPDYGWDGRFKGEDVKKDVYIYKVVMTNICNGHHESMGRVTVAK